jgi:YVTN family beta-propeller protein
MQKNDDKIQSAISFLIILYCIALVFISPSLTYAQKIQELHQLKKSTMPNENAHIELDGRPNAIRVIEDRIYVTNPISDSISVIEATNSTKIGDIKVGDKPSAIGFVVLTAAVYVANSDNDTVSVIDWFTNTKIGDDIKVGKEPLAIGVYQTTGTVYVANSYNDTVSVIEATNSTKIGDIKVGDSPWAIGIDHATSKVYVANEGNDTVSVIEATNSTKIGDDIKVGGGPWAIGVDEARNRVYVANYYNDTVSVIDGRTDTKIGDDIKVGRRPSAIGIDHATSKVYVANSIDGTVSVIDGRTDTKIGDDIKVGYTPWAIDVDQTTGTVYVANFGSNSLSVIDGNANKLVAGVTLDVKPFNGGHIECYKDRVIAPTVQQFYLWSGSECTAKPNEGFEFVSWQENLGRNSTQLLSVASPPSFFDSILDVLHLRPDKPESKLNVTKFGSFTANFKALPPPIPPEYVATLFTVVATAFIGSWLTPTVIGWRKARKEGSKLDHYHNGVKKLYNDGKLDRNDIGELNKLRDNITDEHTRGKINKEQYGKLADEISIIYGEIFTKEIDSLNSLSENGKAKQLSAIRNDVEGLHAKGRLNNELYVNLKKQISVLYEELFRRRIDSLNGTLENNKAKLLAEIKDDISDAYSKERINELHYTLLKEKVSNYEINK